MKEIWRRSARETADGIVSGQTSAVEVVSAHLGRIGMVNPSVNAIVETFDEKALEAAAAADIVVACGLQTGPLHGVPFVIKQNIDVAGSATTLGLPALANAVAPLDAPAVEKLRKAGAIPIGKSNMPDMGLGVVTQSSLHGLTRNPWCLSRSAGGEAVAVATGMSVFGLGTDFGGCLRNPASTCGVVCLQPTVGRIADAGNVPSADRLMALQLMKVVGPVARSVGDLKLLLNALTGHHPRDPWSARAVVPRALTVGKPKVALVKQPPGSACGQAVLDALERAGSALEQAGYSVEEACPPNLEETLHTFGKIMMGDHLASLAETASLMGVSARQFLQHAMDIIGPPRTLQEMSALMVQRDRIARAWSIFFQDYPLVVMPVWTQIPPALGSGTNSIAEVGAIFDMMRTVFPTNLMGLPAVCVPAGRDFSTNVPVGVQIVAPPFHEDLCLDAAGVVEAAVALQMPVTLTPATTSVH